MSAPNRKIKIRAETGSGRVRRPDENKAMEWLDLRHLTHYAAISERTLRTWIHDSADPLLAYQVGSKILVRKRDFDGYIERHPLRPAGTLENVVNEILTGIKG